MFTKDINEFKGAIETSYSILETLHKLGMKPSGSNYTRVKRLCRENCISMKHFLGQKSMIGKTRPSTRKLPLSTILVEHSSYANTNALKKKLIAEGIFSHQCSVCGITKWLEEPTPIQLDHINGIRDDNRLENLRLLCPNCHAQTETYCGKNKKK